MTRERRRAADRAAFDAIASDFARTLVPGDVVALAGDLGAGKTTFVAAAVRALHGSDDVTSPTFTIRQHYPGEPPIEHLDLFRLTGADAMELGLHEAFAPTGIAFVEWPDRLPGVLPGTAIRVRIDGVGDGERLIGIERP